MASIVKRMTYELANAPYINPATSVIRNRYDLRDAANLA